MSYLFAFDPGQTCGWALFWVEPSEPAKLLDCGEIPADPAELERIWRLRAGQGVVVCEDWSRNDRSVDARMALWPTGMLLMLAHQADVPVGMQRPQFRLSVGDSELGLGSYWRPNLKAHDDRRQAIRHGLAYLIHTAHHLPTVQALHPR